MPVILPLLLLNSDVEGKIFKFPMIVARLSIAPLWPHVLHFVAKKIGASLHWEKMTKQLNEHCITCIANAPD